MNTDFPSWINPLISEEIAMRLREQFKKAKPYPHILIKNFLDEKKAEILLENLKRERFIEKESDLFNFKQTDDLYFSKNKVIMEFHNSFLSWDFFNFVNAVTGKKLRGTLDMAGTLYESGAYLLCHDDELEGRKIAYVLYLSKGFSKEDGGDFVLYNSKNGKPTKIARSYSPEWNSLLVFEVSAKSFHEVKENISGKNRYAIGGWLH